MVNVRTWTGDPKDLQLQLLVRDDKRDEPMIWANRRQWHAHFPMHFFSKIETTHRLMVFGDSFASSALEPLNVCFPPFSILFADILIVTSWLASRIFHAGFIDGQN